MGKSCVRQAGNAGRWAWPAIRGADAATQFLLLKKPEPLEEPPDPLSTHPVTPVPLMAVSFKKRREATRWPFRRGRSWPAFDHPLALSTTLRLHLWP